MKKQRFLSMALAMALALTLATPALADSGTTIGRLGDPLGKSWGSIDGVPSYEVAIPVGGTIEISLDELVGYPGKIGTVSIGQSSASLTSIDFKTNPPLYTITGLGEGTVEVDYSQSVGGTRTLLKVYLNIVPAAEYDGVTTHAHHYKLVQQGNTVVKVCMLCKETADFAPTTSTTPANPDTGSTATEGATTEGTATGSATTEGATTGSTTTEDTTSGSTTTEGATTTTQTPNSGHTHDWKQKVEAATCAKTGYSYEECALCGARQNVKTLPKTEHTLKTERVVSQPSVYSAGAEVVVCTVCGYRYTREIPKLTTEASVANTRSDTAAAPAAKTALTAPTVSDNLNKQDYTSYAASTVKSYLYANESGGLTRVEYAGGKVVVENYDSSFKFQSGFTLEMELPVWGGFYAGENYNFLIFGQNNPSESDSLEVIRVVKYSKDWSQRLGAASICGANTETPFRSGSLRCAEYNGYLYIRTCHRMFKSSDGLNHQANVMLEVNENTMTVIDAFTSVSNIRNGYVSHSFNQFILVDQDKNIIAMDHGDAYPRSIVLVKYGNKAGEITFGRNCASSTVQSFPGAVGANTTGASVGGLAETAGGYVSAYNYDGQAGAGPRDVYLGFTSKNGLTSKTTQVSSGAGGTTTPVLASTGLNGGYILWNSKGGSQDLYYASYSDGGSVGAAKSAVGSLSDCAPVYWNGEVVWYVTNKSTPTFYTLDASGVAAHATGSTAQPSTPTTGSATQPNNPATGSATQPNTPTTGSTTQPNNPADQISFTDVPAAYWGYDDITAMAKLGVVDGFGNGLFKPEDKVKSVEFSKMVACLLFKDELAGHTNTSNWWRPYMDTLLEAGALENTEADSMRTGTEWQQSLGSSPMSRYDMAMVMYNTLKVKGIAMPSASEINAARAVISDYDTIPAQYKDAVAAMYAMGCLKGMDNDNNFRGSQQMNRAQACTVLVRLQQKIG